MTQPNASPAMPGRQRGVTLIIALMVLAVLTIAGMGVIGMSSVEMRIAQNEKASQVAFEAAESGLRRVMRSPTLRQTLLNPYANGTDPVADVQTVNFNSAPGDWTSEVEIQPLGASLPCPISSSATATSGVTCVFYEITSVGQYGDATQRGASKTVIGSVYVQVGGGHSGTTYATE
ncbi:MAG: PilX N-terminal domain-containing pilus assembly protein [Pseudomonadota bacterium]